MLIDKTYLGKKTITHWKQQNQLYEVADSFVRDFVNELEDSELSKELNEKLTEINTSISKYKDKNFSIVNKELDSIMEDVHAAHRQHKDSSFLLKSRNNARNLIDVLELKNTESAISKAFEKCSELCSNGDASILQPADYIQLPMSMFSSLSLKKSDVEEEYRIHIAGINTYKTSSLYDDHLLWQFVDCPFKFDSYNDVNNYFHDITNLPSVFANAGISFQEITIDDNEYQINKESGAYAFRRYSHADRMLIGFSLENVLNSKELERRFFYYVNKTNDGTADFSFPKFQSNFIWPIYKNNSNFYKKFYRKSQINYYINSSPFDLRDYTHLWVMSDKGPKLESVDNEFGLSIAFVTT